MPVSRRQGIVNFVDTVPEFLPLLVMLVLQPQRIKKGTLTEKKKRMPKSLFTSYSKADANVVKDLVDKLVNRIQTEERLQKLETPKMLLFDLPRNFQAIWCFAPFCLMSST